jgi:hypothetical protein
MENSKSVIPADIEPVQRVFDRDVENLFYSRSKNQFYTRNRRFKQPSVHDLRPILWNEINLKHTNKKGEEKTCSYPYASIPFEKTYVRLKESEWLKTL